MRLLTIHDHPHTLDEAVNNLESLNCCSSSLVLRESVKPLQDRLDIVLSEGFLYEFDYVALSRVTRQRERDSLDRRCLSSLVARASVVINSTNILTTVSSIVGVAGIRVYISRRFRKCSMDSSKSTSTLKLEITPLTVWFTWMSQRYLHIMSHELVNGHTSSSIPRQTCIALAGGNDV